MNTFLKKHWVTLVGSVGIIVILVGLGFCFLPQYLYQGGICAFCGLILFIIAVINNKVEVPAEQDAKVAKPSQADKEKLRDYLYVFGSVLAFVSLIAFLIVVSFPDPDTWKYWLLCVWCTLLMLSTGFHIALFSTDKTFGNDDVGFFMLILFIVSFIGTLNELLRLL